MLEPPDCQDRRSLPGPPWPRGQRRDRCRYERQERKFGGLPLVVRRQLESVSADQTTAMAEPPLKLKPGTRLVREWNGTIYTVLVTADGFDFAGKSWRSLSMIARHITGAQWSGPRFFGLRRAGKA
ncbi:MAG: DUF2924 domain-containing protein [Sphingomonadales bacterium]|nr:DUF2924 domain-containing protein [Sphingomonadales bacterium]